MDGVGERGGGVAEAGVVGVDEDLQALAAALNVDHGLGAGQHHVGARVAGGGAGVALRPAQDGAVGLGGVGGGEHDRRCRVVVALRAQALDRARERELGTAEPVDEVAAARDADRLERGELVIQRGETAGDPLGQHLLAGDDAVALEQ